MTLLKGRIMHYIIVPKEIIIVLICFRQHVYAFFFNDICVCFFINNMRGQLICTSIITFQSQFDTSDIENTIDPSCSILSVILPVRFLFSLNFSCEFYSHSSILKTIETCKDIFLYKKKLE